MTCLFLTLLLLSSINSLKAHVHPKDCQVSNREFKKENDSLLEDFQVASECLHRIRRDNSLQNEIKKRKKTGAKWSDKRKQEHMKFMKKHWKNKKEDVVHNRRKEHGRLMRIYWQKYKEKGNTHNVSRKMFEYWKRQKENGGITEIQKQHSKKMKAYWQGQNDDIRRKRRERLKNLWRNQKEKRIKHGEKLKEYWRKQREQGGNNKNKLLSEKKKEYWRRRRKAMGYNCSAQEMRERKREQRKRRRERKKKIMLERRNKLKMEGTTKLLTLKERMDAYWNNIREQENKLKEKTTTNIVKIEVTTRMKTLKEKIEEYWKNTREYKIGHPHKTIHSEKEKHKIRKVKIERTTKRKTRKYRMNKNRNKQGKEKSSSKVFGDKYIKSTIRKNAKVLKSKRTFRRKDKMEMTTKRKTLKERMDEYWKNIREEEKRNEGNIGNQNIHSKKTHEDGKVQSITERMKTFSNWKWEDEDSEENKILDNNNKKHLRQIEIEEPNNMKTQYEPTRKAFDFRESSDESSAETDEIWTNEKKHGNTRTNKIFSDKDKDLEISRETTEKEITTEINLYYNPAGAAFDFWREFEKNPGKFSTEDTDEDSYE